MDLVYDCENVWCEYSNDTNTGPVNMEKIHLVLYVSSHFSKHFIDESVSISGRV